MPAQWVPDDVIGSPLGTLLSLSTGAELILFLLEGNEVQAQVGLLPAGMLQKQQQIPFKQRVLATVVNKNDDRATFHERGLDC